jgi:hypothetical protein
MKKTIKQKGITLIILSTLILMGFRPSEMEEGFYLNNGKNKISELSCYTFDDLSVKFPILPEMFGYDWVLITVNKYNAKDELSSSCGFGYDGSVFNAKYKNKESSEFTFFKKGEQKHCLKDGELTRVSLMYTNAEKGLIGACIQLQIYGSMITGYSERVVGNRIIKEPTYSSATIIYEGQKLPLTNREKVNRFKLLTITKVDLSLPCGTSKAVSTEK